MTFYVENESGTEIPFDYELIAEKVMLQALEYIHCPYETQINLIITDNEEIKRINKMSRGIDKSTDVLSFPNVDFLEPGEFELVDESEADYFDPESGELILGDIMVSFDKVLEQAKEYGHSVEREYAFLIAHSMFHLFGYDHETKEEAVEMERMQEEVLQILNITRD